MKNEQGKSSQIDQVAEEILRLTGEMAFFFSRKLASQALRSDPSTSSSLAEKSKSLARDWYAEQLNLSNK